MAKYGIVILNYQKYQMTEQCVLGLLGFELDTKILIVDNASSNDSYDYLKDRFDKIESVEVIRNDVNAGYARGNNVGFRYLFDKYEDMKYCCVMNPDVEIRYGEIFDNLMEKLSIDESYAAATGLMITNGTLNINSCFWSIPKGAEIALGHSVLHKNVNKPLKCNEFGVAEVEVLPGSFFMIKREVYEKLGGFDEGTFLYNEENILATQLTEMGYKNILSIEDSYNHNHPKGERLSLHTKLVSRKIGNASRSYLCKKYYSMKYLLLLKIIIASNAVVITVKHLAGNVRIMVKS